MSGWLFWLQQAAASWGLLAAVGACMGLPRRMLRLSLAAVGCGAVTLVCVGTPWRVAALAGLALAAPAVAYPGVPVSRRPRMSLCCLCLTLLMAGGGRLLRTLGLGGTPLVLVQAAGVPVLARLAPPGSQAGCIQVEITHQGRRLELTALVDSGNLLRDPLTHLPVVILPHASAGAFAALPGLRLIPIRTAAGQSLLPVFQPQQVRVHGAGGWRRVQVAVGLGASGCALAPACVLSPTQGGIPCP